jgi:O-antigen/teichoic acid export membrane protein
LHASSKLSPRIRLARDGGKIRPGGNVHQSSRLILNGAVMLGRLFLTFGVGLYATRVLVNLLGYSDFGLLASMGATGALVVFVGHSLNMSAQRALAHEIGRDDLELLVEAFNSTLAIFLIASAGLLVLGLMIEPLVVAAIQIPEGRADAAAWVFRLTVLHLVIETAITPFRSIVVARQAMTQIAVFDTLRSLLSLVAVLLLFHVEGDALVLYATFLLLGSILRSAGMALLTVYRFPESRPRPGRIRIAQLRRVSQFAGWASLLGLASQMRNQAALVLLGAASGPVVTAAYAVAMRMGSYHSTLAQVLPRVTQPAMTARMAKEDRTYVRTLALMTGKYSTLGVLFVVVPLLIETQGVLRLWLGSVPPETALFVRLAMTWLTIDVLSNGFHRAAFAHGDLRVYAIATCTLSLLSLVACAVALFAFGADPWSVPAIMLATTLAQIFVRVGHVGRLIGVGYPRWLRETLLPTLVPAGAGTAAAALVHFGMTDAWPRYLAVGFAYGIVACPLIWLVSVGEREKNSLRRLAASVVPRARGWLAP